MATRVAKFGIDVGDEVPATANPALAYVVPVGRALFAAIFVMAFTGHFSRAYVQYAASQGVPAPQILVPLSGVIAIAGGLSVLLGFKARIGAWLLVLFLVPVTLWMHAFWAVADPMMRQMQQVQFMKNLGLLGASLLVAYFGAGPYSFDAARAERLHAHGRERVLPPPGVPSA